MRTEPRVMVMGLALVALAAGCGKTKTETPDAGGTGQDAAGAIDEGAPGTDTGAPATDTGAPAQDATTPPPQDAAADAGTIGPVDAGVGGEPPPLSASVRLHIAGDSTAAIFPATDPTMRVGWGSVLQMFFTTGVTVNDAARSGRSSKSFIDEGFWTTLKAQIQPGDYVFIQFAHNDEKTDDPARYTDPATTFRYYLETYIAETRAAGGFPVLLTPICRRQFSGTTIVNTHGAYPAAVMAVASDTGTPLIDMTERTRVWLEGLGPTASVAMFATGDNTHLSAMGAPEVAKLVVAGIRDLNLPIAARLAP